MVRLGEGYDEGVGVAAHRCSRRSKGRSIKINRKQGSQCAWSQMHGGGSALKMDELAARDQRSPLRKVSCLCLVSSLSLWLVSDGGFWGSLAFSGFSGATNATGAGGNLHRQRLLLVARALNYRNSYCPHTDKLH